MLGTCQAMWLMAWRLTKLYEAGRMSHEQASLVKAWTTLRGREVRLGVRPWRAGGLAGRQAPAAGSVSCATRPSPHLHVPTCCPPPPQVVALGRELLGGNGILSDFLCAKAFADMEAYYS